MKKEKKQEDGLSNYQEFTEKKSDKGGNGVLIHTMPSYFLAPQINTSKNKGLIILIIGALLFFCVALFLYFYLVRPYFGNRGGGAPVQTDMVAGEEPDIDQKTDSKKEPSFTESVIEEELVSEQPANELETEDSLVSADIPEEEVADVPRINVNENSEESEILPPTSKLIADQDGDGLSDAEEELFGTNKVMVDSDGDTYPDLAEIKGLYNPAGEGNILTNTNIGRYDNNDFGYSLYYVRAWPADRLSGANTVMFKMNNNQFVQIIVEANNSGLDLEEWYKDQLDVEGVSEDQYINKKGWTGIKNADSLVFYMHPENDSSNIFIISYGTGASPIPYYKNIFDLIVNSLTIK